MYYYVPVNCNILQQEQSNFFDQLFFKSLLCSYAECFSCLISWPMPRNQTMLSEALPVHCHIVMTAGWRNSVYNTHKRKRKNSVYKIVFLKFQTCRPDYIAVYWFASLFGQKGTYNLGLVPVRKHLKNMYGFFIPANIIDKFKAVAIFKQARMVTFIPN